MKMRQKKRMAALAAFLFAASSALAADADYPTRTVRVVVAYTPGGGVDIMGRIITGELTKRLGQPFIVDNRPGGGTIIGSDLVAHAAPDGYTLLFGNPALVATPALVDKVPFDAAKAFSSTGMIGASFNVLVVHPSLPVKTVKQFVALAKKTPGKLNYASAGRGSAIHLAMELFEDAAGINLEHIAYKGAAPAITDVLAGQVTVMFATTPPAVQYMRTGRLRPLGVTSRERLAVLPTVPTIAESGYPGFELSNWYSLLAPAQTPRAIIDKLNREIIEILRQPDVKERIAALGNAIETSTPQQFDERIRKEIAMWQRVLKKK
jgi:tripartite-type tricarboxylate transporter receptor subunit TctC